jgi:hypothetical protein
MMLRVRALPHGPYPFFRRAGFTFSVGSDVVIDADEATEAILLREVDRLKVERVPAETTPTPRPSPTPTPAAAPGPAAARPEFEIAGDGSSVPMVGGAAAKGSRRS